MLLRRATEKDADRIWEIIQAAIEKRRAEGSMQWQDGYPNPQSIATDIEQGYGYVLADGESILAYTAIIFDKEPAYEVPNVDWLNGESYVVIHRVATASEVRGSGKAILLFQMAEKVALNKGIFNIRVDTNFDNQPMLHILDKLGYKYCGKVYLRGGERQKKKKILL